MRRNCLASPLRARFPNSRIQRKRTNLRLSMGGRTECSRALKSYLSPPWSSAMPKGRWIREMGSPSSGPSIRSPRATDKYLLRSYRHRGGYRSSLVFSPILASPVADNAETTNLQLWPPYPGFDSALHADWPAKPTRTHTRRPRP